MNKVLIIDDDQDIRVLLKKFLEKNDFEVHSVDKGEPALELLREIEFDVILCDYKLPDLDGVELLRKINILSPNASVIIITGYSDVRIAVKAIKYGAFDYVTKPLRHEQLLDTVKRAVKHRPEEEEKVLKKTSSGAPKEKPGVPKSSHSENKIVKGSSAESEKLWKHVELVAPTDMTVIIEGETGTGKESVARIIHEKSNRRDKPFIAIDCGALPKDIAGSELFGHIKGSFTGAIKDKKGQFEHANGGTLFLDEIGNLTYEVQVKMLRVLQERKIKRIGGADDIPIDVRIITATNDDLIQSVEEDLFREDLYHRINEFKIRVPALNERKQDIFQFAEHFLALANSELNKEVEGFDEKVREIFYDYQWSGNLREMKNVIKRSVLLTTGDVVKPEHLPAELLQPVRSTTVIQSEKTGENLKRASEYAESELIIKTLERAGFNKTKAAKMLNIDRKTLYNKLKAYEISL